MGLPSASQTTLKVDELGDRFEMRGVAAEPLAAKVIQNQAGGNGANQQGVGQSVDSPRPALVPDGAVAAAALEYGTGPDPAWVRKADAGDLLKSDSPTDPRRERSHALASITSSAALMSRW